MEGYLKEIAYNTRSKDSIQFIVSGNTTNIRTQFDPPIKLNRDSKYEIALVNLETYYSFPNIDSTKNLIRYSNDSGTTWTNISIPEGSYEIDDMNEYITQQMKQNSHYDTANNVPYISITANANTLKTVMTIATNYQVDFRPVNSLNKVLGFNNSLYTAGYYESENLVNILSLNSLFVHIDIINGSYVNGLQKQSIHSFQMFHQDIR